MKLYTEVAIPDYPFRIDHRSGVLMMGSCFAENIGKILERNLFHVCLNPFGVVYNPLSLQMGLTSLLRKESYTADDLDHFNDRWFSFDHYTLFSSADRDKTLEQINQRFSSAKKVLREADYLVLTWGTSWIFTHNSSGRVVSNCHKIPASEFTRRRMGAEEIVKSYDLLLPLLFEHNPDLKILVTVSPVRHWKEGAHGNQLSKAILLLAQESLETKYPDQVFYFPSYEIVMDELRDYRFYAPDLIHTGDQANQYIWEKFENALLSGDAKHIIGELDPLLKMMEHRPLIREGDTANRMEAVKAGKLSALREKYPLLAWENLHQTSI